MDGKIFNIKDKLDATVKFVNETADRITHNADKIFENLTDSNEAIKKEFVNLETQQTE